MIIIYTCTILCLYIVHPSSYKRSKSRKFSAVNAEVKSEDSALHHEQEIMEDGQKLFKCTVCGESFKTPQSYSGHCRLHRGTKIIPYTFFVYYRLGNPMISGTFANWDKISWS